MVSESDLFYIIPLCIGGFTFWVGLYVYMFLTIMRIDPREQEFRKRAGLTNRILPTAGEHI